MKSRRLPQNLTSLYLLAILTLFLFTCGLQGYANITASKFHAFCALTGGYTALMAAALAIEQTIHKSWRAFFLQIKKATLPQWAAAAYAAVTWVSALCSPQWPQTFLGVSRYEGAATITLYVAAFLLVSAYGQADRWLLWVLGGSVSLFSILCLVQFGGLNPFALYPAGYTYLDAGIAYPGAYLGTLGNVDLVAAFYSLALPILLYGLPRLKGRCRFFLLIPLALGFLTVLKMDVSAGHLGVLAGCILAFPLAALKGKARRIGLFALFFLILFSLAILFFFDIGGGMLHEAHEVLHGRVGEYFGSGRVHIWQEVLKKVPQHPLLGAGPDTMLTGDLTPFTRYDERLATTLVSRIDVAHNEYLNVLYHQGVLGLAAYLCLLVSLCREWCLTAEKDGAAAALGAGAVGYCVQALFGFSMCLTAPFFWLCLGLLARRGKQL